MLNIIGINGNDNLYLVLELFEQSDFSVRLIAWQDAVFQHFTAEFHVKFALKLINALQDMVALQV